MNKKLYNAPKMELHALKVERGFALSDPEPSYAPNGNEYFGRSSDMDI